MEEKNSTTHTLMKRSKISGHKKDHPEKKSGSLCVGITGYQSPMMVNWKSLVLLILANIVLCILCTFYVKENLEPLHLWYITVLSANLTALILMKSVQFPSFLLSIRGDSSRTILSELENAVSLILIRLNQSQNLMTQDLQGIVEQRTQMILSPLMELTYHLRRGSERLKQDLKNLKAEKDPYQ